MITITSSISSVITVTPTTALEFPLEFFVPAWCCPRMAPPQIVGPPRCAQAAHLPTNAQSSRLRLSARAAEIGSPGPASWVLSENIYERKPQSATGAYEPGRILTRWSPRTLPASRRWSGPCPPTPCPAPPSPRTLRPRSCSRMAHGPGRRSPVSVRTGTVAGAWGSAGTPARRWAAGKAGTSTTPS